MAEYNEGKHTGLLESNEQWPTRDTREWKYQESLIFNHCLYKVGLSQ